MTRNDKLIMNLADTLDEVSKSVSYYKKGPGLKSLLRRLKDNNLIKSEANRFIDYFGVEGDMGQMRRKFWLNATTGETHKVSTYLRRLEILSLLADES